MTDEEMRAAAQDLYDRVLQTANRFLTAGKLYSVQFLAKENPTFSEVAALMSQVVDIIEALSHRFDPMMHAKALEYCSYMVKMGAAIAAKDQPEVTKLCQELDRKPFL